jgi:hypothetical protein
MRLSRPSFATAGLAVVGVLLVASCSSSSSPAAATTSAPSSSGPSPTFSVASTSPVTVSAPVTVSSPVTATTPSTTTTATTTTAAPTTTTAGPKLYAPTSAPKVPTTHTDPVSATGAVKDGVYWSQLVGGDATHPSVTLTQAFFGAECQSKATAMGDECLNDIYLLAKPTRDIASLKFAPGAKISVADPNTMQSLLVTADELVFLRTSGPTGGAPKNYAYAPFAYLMTVKGGTITGFEQVWTP